MTGIIIEFKLEQIREIKLLVPTANVESVIKYYETEGFQLEEAKYSLEKRGHKLIKLSRVNK